MMPEAPALESRPRLVAFGPFAFDPQNRMLSRDGAEIPLPPRVIGVLELLISRPGEVVPRQELLDRVWKDAFVTDTSLAEAISFLRQALGDDPQAPRYVQTVHRRGYRFLQPTPQPPSIRPREPSPAPAVTPSIARDLAPWSIAVISAVLAITAVWQAVRRPVEQPPPLVRFELGPAPGSSFDRRAPALAIAPDSQTFAWSGCDGSLTCRLYVRRLDRLEPVALRDTDGARSPFFSPDGRWIGFFADGKLKKIAASGGSPATLADAPAPAGASWSADGRIVFAGTAAGGLSIVSDQGGDVRSLTRPLPERGELRHGWPSWLPDGRAVVFTIFGSPVPGALGQLAVLPIPSTSWRVLRSGAARAMAAGNGYLLVSTGTDLQAQTFDQRTLTMTGGAEGVVEGLASAHGMAQFTVNDAGTLMTVNAASAKREIVWSDRPSQPVPGAARIADLTISPDSRRAAGVTVDASGSDIVVIDLDRGSATRVTYGGINTTPVWAPDGRLLSATRTTGPFAIVATNPGAAGGTQPLLKSDTHLFPGSVAPDGRLAIVKTLGDGRLSLGIVPRGGTEPALFDDGPFDQAMPSFSPDGAWLAFTANASGRWEVFVRNLSDGRRIAVSTEGGERPSWAADGRSMYFYNGNRVLRASFDARSSSPVARPEVVFDGGNGRIVAVSPSGRFLVERQPPGQDTAVVALEWLRELRQRLTPPVTAPR